MRKPKPSTYVNVRNPQGAARCDGCGIAYPYPELREQMDYRGGETVVPTGRRVCSMCEDTPNEQFRKPVSKPDPLPLKHARPLYTFPYLSDEVNVVLADQDESTLYWD